MADIIKEESGRKFQRKPGEDNKWIFDRTDNTNNLDIAYSASLAFHKSLIGICGLDEMETAEKELGSNLRSAKAIQTYYVLYHLFTGCMLLDPDYEIVFSASKAKNAKGRIYYGQKQKALRKTPVSARDWDLRGKLEQDLATRIRHSDIKKYCDSIREKMKQGAINQDYIKTLYDYYIREDGSVFLFEMADYIRDRSIYRPSFVPYYSNNKFNYSQTSKNVRSQIDGMPSAKELYQTIRKILLSICIDPAIPKDDFHGSFLHNSIDCKTEYSNELGYSWDILSKLGGDKEGEQVPVFIGQMMELYVPEKTEYYFEKYWKTLFDEFRDTAYSISPRIE